MKKNKVLSKRKIGIKRANDIAYYKRIIETCHHSSISYQNAKNRLYELTKDKSWLTL
ncbi:MAG: hypothetical protein WC223_13385 [Bacteroidales bacterium]|jgi:hypothetical protein